MQFRFPLMTLRYIGSKSQRKWETELHSKNFNVDYIVHKHYAQMSFNLTPPIYSLYIN